MRMTVLLSLFGLACAPQTTVLGGDDTSNDNGGGGDTGAGDSGGGGDTGDTQDTSPPPDVSEGDYTGTFDGSMESDWGGMDCTGDAAFSVDADGNITGTLTCAFDNGGWGGYTYEGDVSGTELDGDVEVAWTLDFGRDSVDVPGVGTYAEGEMTIDFEYDFGNYGLFTGTALLERQ